VTWFGARGNLSTILAADSTNCTVWRIGEWATSTNHAARRHRAACSPLIAIVRTMAARVGGEPVLKEHTALMIPPSAEGRYQVLGRGHQTEEARDVHMRPLRERPRAVWEMSRRGMRVRSVREEEALTAIHPDARLMVRRV
jgi:hypothetical protein